MSGDAGDDAGGRRDDASDGREPHDRSDARAGHGDRDGVGTGALHTGVRAAMPSDLSRLLAIQAAAFPDPHRRLLRTGVRAGLALVATGVAGDDTTGRDPAGYLLFTADDRSVYVAELAVAPGERRRGHGRRLLAAVAARHPDRDHLRLTTRVDNERARAFYEALGFREVRRLPGHSDGENANDDVETGTCESEAGDVEAGESEAGAPAGDASTDGVLLVRDLE
jgi:ribosomal-protein-alanine N-acetyltransferase